MDTREKVLNRYESLKGKEYLKEKIIDGVVVASKLREEINLKKEYILEPMKLVLIQVGDDYGSEQYLKSIEKNCNDFCIQFELVKLNKDIDQDTLNSIVRKYGVFSNNCSVMIHTPLPKHIDTHELYNNILPSRDVDCVNPFNISNVFDTSVQASILPCTVAGVMSIIDYYNIELEGKKVVVLGRSMTVGKPLSAVLEKKNATVTVCHSKTPYNLLKYELKNADIIISAIGKAKYIKENMIGVNQVLIDVGINFQDGKMCGDFDFENVIGRSRLITPVPFGVGTTTSMNLIKNIIINYIERKGERENG